MKTDQKLRIGALYKVESTLVNYTVTGKLVFVFPAGILPSRQDVIRYYFGNDPETFEDSQQRDTFLRAPGVNKIVIQRTTGCYSVVNQSDFFRFTDLSESDHDEDTHIIFCKNCSKLDTSWCPHTDRAGITDRSILSCKSGC